MNSKPRAIYDDIGIGYTTCRRPDPRIAAAILDALGNARSVLNVGAGAGSYEPQGCEVVALEPSREMLQQRARDAAPAVQGWAESIPFANDSFDACLACLTLHHWRNQRAGVEEMIRVARERVVIFTFDSRVQSFWLYGYLPEFAALDRKTGPDVDGIAAHFSSAELWPVPIPHDCVDGFLGAYWRRPEAYLDATVQAAISSFSLVDDREEGLARLRSDLDSGRWRSQYGELLDRRELDLGYRLIVGACG